MWSKYEQTHFRGVWGQAGTDKHIINIDAHLWNVDPILRLSRKSHLGFLYMVMKTKLP